MPDSNDAASQRSAAWLDTDVARQLAADLVAQARRQYRIGEADALAVARELLRGQRAIAAAVTDGHGARQIERTRQFKDLASATRKKIYYQLRRYDREDDFAQAALGSLNAMPPGEHPGADVIFALAAGHVSTAERLPTFADFHAALFASIGRPESILDVGCGVYPLLFPFDQRGASVASYVAADRDPRSLAILESYARARGDGRLLVAEFDINDGWRALIDRAGRPHFDVAFLFKLVPVVRRQDRGAYRALAQVPADLLVLTGATSAMTRNRSIERRERNVLLSFAHDAGLTVLAQSAAGEEYMVVASR